MRLARIITDRLQGIRAAIAFLTRVPMCYGSAHTLGLAEAPSHFPLVGALLGGLGALLWRFTARLPLDLRAWLVIATLLLVTGAFHEDGLADTADALGGAFTRDKLFEILKDSRIGTFGAVALICTLAIRASLLSHLMPRGVWVLVVSQSASRFAPVLLMKLLPYVTESRLSRSRDITRVNTGHVVVAALWTVMITWVAIHFYRASIIGFLVAVTAHCLAVTWLAWRFKRRAGGLTGDFLGATQQIGEIAFLAGLSAWQH